MPLGAVDEDRLRQGQLVWADVRQSFTTLPAGEHPAILVDPDDVIKEVIAGKATPAELYVVVISHTTTIDPPETQLPAPARWGLTGHIQGRWVVNVELARINRLIPARANAIELARIIALTRK
jgi:mRNA-degrading endonuclease toxin of MazEF toxin-antitoxin module